MDYNITGCELHDEYGQYTSASISYRCWNISATSVGAAIEAALLGLPSQIGSALYTGSNCYCVKRYGSYVSTNNSGYIIDVVASYEILRTETDYPLRGGSTLEQIETENDKNGDPIVLNYKGIQHIAKINVPIAVGCYDREKIIYTNDPEAEKKKWINKTNLMFWNNGETDSWLCSNCEYEPFNLTSNPRQYKFMFEWQYNDDLFKYTAAFVDEDEKIPADIHNPGNENAIKIISWHDQADFSQLFDV